MQIQPQLLTLHALLNGRLFRIPEYQRSYSWMSKQRADLFGDINKVDASGEPHFLATVVGLRRGTRNILTTDFHDVEVVDGQQRITTLVILLKAIEVALDGAVPAEQAVAQELRQLLVKPDDLAPVLLQTNHDTSQHCVTYLRSGSHVDPATATTLADRHLLDAMVGCEAFVQTWKSRGALLSLVRLLKNQLTFIFHELDNEATVYSVFEVLNSRGLEVSWFDRLKSVLMGLAFESKTGNERQTIDELHRLWREIYACIGLRQGLSTETLKVAATLWSVEQPSRPLGEEEAVESLRVIAARSPRDIVAVSEWLLKVAQTVDVLATDRRRNGVTRIAQARLLATSLLLRADFSGPERASLLALWERVTFRIYGMCGRDARTKVGDYVRLGWSVGQRTLSVPDIEAELRRIGADFPIETALDTIRDADCYNDWQPELRYLLFRYEEYLAARANQRFANDQWNRIWEATAAESIEHVRPQSKGLTQRSDTDIFVHRLGNLILLPPGLNSSLKDRDPAMKADAYIRTGLLQAIEVAARTPTWDRAAVALREEEILSWAGTEWGD